MNNSDSAHTNIKISNKKTGSSEDLSEISNLNNNIPISEEFSMNKYEKKINLKLQNPILKKIRLSLKLLNPILK